MLYLKQVLHQQSKNFEQLNSVNYDYKIVRAITIMEDLNISNWASGGEIILVNSNNLPNNQLLALFKALSSNNICCLIIKPAANTFQLSSEVIDYTTKVQFPVFQMKSSLTYLQIMNNVNRQLFNEQQKDRILDLDFNYLLKSSNLQNSDFDFISSTFQQNLFNQSVRVLQLRFTDIKNPHQRLQTIFNLRTQAFLLLNNLQEQAMIAQSYILEAPEGITILLFFNQKQIKNLTYEKPKLENFIQQLVLTYPNLYIGLSNLYKAPKIHQAYLEVEFTLKVIKLLHRNNQLVSYNDVYFWSWVNQLEEKEAQHVFSEELIKVFRDPQLRKTLIAYFDNDESLQKTSQQLYVHLNTVRYRLQSIHKITGLNYLKTSDKFKLYIAVIYYLLNSEKIT